MKKFCWKMALTVAYRVALVYWFIRRPTARGVYVAIWSGEKLLLIRNSYKKGRTMPAGGVKPGESLLAAAVRETAEEVGIAIDPNQLKVAAEFVSKAEFKRDCSTVFEVEFLEPPEFQIDDCEVESAEYVPVSSINPDELTSIARQYFDWKRDRILASCDS